MFLEGRLNQLVRPLPLFRLLARADSRGARPQDTEIAQLEHELSLRARDPPAHPVPHNFAPLHGSSAAQEERSLAHGRRMGWRAARRYFGEEYAGQGRGF